MLSTLYPRLPGEWGYEEPRNGEYLYSVLSLLQCHHSTAGPQFNCEVYSFLEPHMLITPNLKVGRNALN